MEWRSGEEGLKGLSRPSAEDGRPSAFLGLAERIGAERAGGRRRRGKDEGERRRRGKTKEERLKGKGGEEEDGRKREGEG